MSQSSDLGCGNSRKSKDAEKAKKAALLFKTATTPKEALGRSNEVYMAVLPDRDMVVQCLVGKPKHEWCVKFM